MATILVLAHENDLFRSRPFMIKSFLPYWEAQGHRVLVHEGAARAPAADIAILHVDCTVVPDEYVEATSAYPVVVNGAARDIGKRVVSENLVGPYDAWRGPVLVKTNANASGLPERLHEEVARRKGQPVARPARFMSERYPIFDSIDDVPVEMRLDPELVVEKFLPERDPRGYASRHWIFFGNRERCTRVVGPHPIVKGVDVLDRAPVEIPEELRRHRGRLGLDFGKLDFVVHEGRVVLLDANRTPAVPENLREALRTGMENLAQGIAAWIS
ncbi:MAG: hypothetical protein ACLQVI_03905 [Polyangiaceae bacterium]|jgi:hypothetical protein